MENLSSTTTSYVQAKALSLNSYGNQFILNNPHMVINANTHLFFLVNAILTG